MKIKTALCAAALLGAAAVNTAVAMDQGDWLIRFGASNVDPKSNNHPAYRSIPRPAPPSISPT